MKKLLTLLVAAIMTVACCLGLVGCDGGNDSVNTIKVPEYDSRLIYNGVVDENFKVGFIFLHDEKSTYDLNFINAAKAAVAAYGLSDSQVIMKYNIPEDATCTSTARELVSSGCNVIFADSFSHGEYLLPVANANPTVQFFHATGTGTTVESAPANLHNAFASIYEGRFLAGVVAGMKLDEMIDAGKVDKTQKIKVGYVGAFPYAEVKSGYTSWYLGVLEGCTKAQAGIEMEVTFTSEWYHVDKEKTGAENLIARGCVLISQHADSMGAPSACEKAGVPNVSYNGSTIEACPSTFIVSSRIDWTPYVKYIIAQTVENKAIATDYTGTLKDGSVALTAVNGGVMAKGTIEKLVEVRDQLVAGTLKVFDTSKFTVTIIAPSGAEGDFGTNTNATVDANGKMTGCLADVNDMGDYVPETQAVNNGAFEESKFRSAPYFDLTIDGITRLNVKM